MKDDLVAQFFDGEMVELSPEQQAEFRRQSIFNKIDEHIEAIIEDHTAWQQLTHSRIGNFGMGAITLAGWNDLDGTEKWRWLREQYEQATHEDLLALEFEE